MSQVKPFSQRTHPKTLVLFDVDGTLTPVGLEVESDILEMLTKLRGEAVIGFVGGSDLAKQEVQFGADVLNIFDYCFSENGSTAYKNAQKCASQSFINFLGEDKYKKLANFILKYIADLDIPIKRGTFIEFRNGMINVSPIGRNCAAAEHKEFEAYDLKQNIRPKFIQALKEAFSDYGLTYSIGGQISFDVFPQGWDKTCCLRHVQDEGFETIHFFGDKTAPGGNDYEIYNHPDVTGHAVTNPNDTIRIINELFF